MHAVDRRVLALDAEGRESIDAIVVFGSALLLCVLGRDPIKDVSARLARQARDPASALTA